MGNPPTSFYYVPEEGLGVNSIFKNLCDTNIFLKFQITPGIRQKSLLSNMIIILLRGYVNYCLMKAQTVSCLTESYV